MSSTLAQPVRSDDTYSDFGKVNNLNFKNRYSGSMPSVYRLYASQLII